MDTQNGFKKILTAVGFAIKAKDTIIEFSCESLTDLANIPRKNLDSHNRVRLNITKCIILNAIRLQFLDRINVILLLLWLILTHMLLMK